MGYNYITNNREPDKVCGNCKYNGYDYSCGEYVCMNPDSEVYGCYNRYYDTCIDYETNEEE